MDTVIYLDVDGVMSPLPFSEPVDLPEGSGWPWWRKAKAWGFDVDYSVGLVDWLNATARRRDVEVVWATSWCEHAPNDLAPAIGVHGRHWSWLPLRGPGTKLDGIIETHPRSSRAVWIDDDIASFDEAEERLTAAEIQHFLVVPDSTIGLTKTDTQRIDAYLVGHSVSSPTSVLW